MNILSIDYRIFLLCTCIHHIDREYSLTIHDFTNFNKFFTSILHGRLIIVYPQPPVAWRSSDCPVGCSAAMPSLHFASNSATSTWLVHKCWGDSTVRICL